MLQEHNEPSMMSDVQVFTQWTPNPNAFKFITSEFVISSGKASYTDLDECEHIPLVKALLSMESVNQVHLYENVLTVTQDGSADWAELADSVEAAIKQFLPTHDANFERKVEKNRENLPEDVRLVEEILDRTIRPGLQGDGGDVEVLEVENKVVTIKYEGACGSCPSSMAGTLQAITSFLREEFDPDVEVVALPQSDYY